MANKEIQHYIYSFFEKVDALFQNYLTQNKTLCDLRDLDFQNNHFPDYHNQGIQCLYLMRYFYAYFTEYHCLYRNFLEKLETMPRIASIGCGNGVDGAALFFVLKGAPFLYRGFDAVEWMPRATDSLSGDFQYFPVNIANAVLSSNNVLIFPKSLTDFSQEDFDVFINNLTSESFENRVLLLSSIMAEGTQYDIKRMSSVIDKMKQLRFNLVDGKLDDVYSVKQRPCCRLVDAGFPDTMRDFMKTLKMHCGDYNSSDECGECGIDRRPVFTTKHARFQAFLLER